MTTPHDTDSIHLEDPALAIATRWAGAFFASFSSPQRRRRHPHRQPRGARPSPDRHTSAQPWLNRNELTDLLTAAEDEKGPAYALACLVGLNGLRVSEAWGAEISDIGGALAIGLIGIALNADGPVWITVASAAFSVSGAVIAILVARHSTQSQSKAGPPRS